MGCEGSSALGSIDGACIALQSNADFFMCSYSKYVAILGLKSANFEAKITKFDK
jgi:hypothetical protein